MYFLNNLKRKRRNYQLNRPYQIKEKKIIYTHCQRGCQSSSFRSLIMINLEKGRARQSKLTSTTGEVCIPAMS